LQPGDTFDRDKVNRAIAKIEHRFRGKERPKLNKPRISVTIELSKTAIRRETHRLSRGNRDDKRRLLRVGYQAEFEGRLPALVNGKLSSVPAKLLREVSA
jgi:hypothetical protein